MFIAEPSNQRIQTAKDFSGSLTSGFFLQYNGTTFNLQAVSGGSGSVAIGSSITGVTAGSLLYGSSGAVLAQDNANLFWDGTNHRLGLGTATPAGKLDVKAGAASEVPITARGAASQSGDYLRCLDNLGQVEARILPGGHGWFQGQARIGELTGNGPNYVGLQAPADLTANAIYTLPVYPLVSGQVLSSDTLGVMAWITPASSDASQVQSNGKLYWPVRAGNTFKGLIHHDTANGIFDVDYNGQDAARDVATAGSILRTEAGQFKFITRAPTLTTVVDRLTISWDAGIRYAGRLQLNTDSGSTFALQVFDGPYQAETFEQFKINEYTVICGKAPLGSATGNETLHVFSRDGSQPITVLQGAASQTGAALVVRQLSSNSTVRATAAIDAPFASPTDASWKGRLVLSAVDSAGTREGLRIESSGTAPMMGVLGAPAALRQTVNAAATDAASTQTLCNQLRAALITFGYLV